MVMCFHKTLGLFVLLGSMTLLHSAPAVAVEPIEQQLNIRNQTFDQGRLRQEAERLVELGRQSVANEDYNLGVAAWQEAIEIYSTLEDSQAVGEISESLAKLLIALDRYDEAEAVLQQRLSVARENNDLDGQIYGLNNLGTAYIHQGEIAAAQTAFAEALQLAREASKPAGVGLSLSNLGLAAWRLGDLETAQRYYEAATGYRLQAGDELGLAHSSNSLGQIYQQLGDPGKALGAYLVARRTALDISHVPILLTALDGLIDIYSDRGDVEQLRTYVGERVVFTEEDASPEQKLGMFIGLGKYYEQLEDEPRARESYRRALELAEQVGDSQQKTYILNRLQQLAST